MAEEKKGFIGTVKSTTGDFLEKVGKTLPNIKRKEPASQEEPVDPITVATEGTSQGNDALKTASGETAATRKEIKHTLVQLSGSKIILLLPDGYERIKRRNLEGFAKNILNTEACYSKTTSASLNVVMVSKITAEQAMNPNDPQSIIDQIHGSLSYNQGLIEVRNGVTQRGCKYICSIVKNLEPTLSCGVDYLLQADIFGEDETIRVTAKFTEIGTTGLRETACIELARRAGVANLTNDDFAGWLQDPYDPSFTKGCLKNLAEMEGLDGLFPDSPLSQAHDLLLAIVCDRLVLEQRGDAGKEECVGDGTETINPTDDSNAEADELSFLRSLFVDESRRHTYSVDVKPNNGRKTSTKTADNGNGSPAESEECQEDVTESDHGEKKKRDKLDNQLRQAVQDYNAVYTDLEDHGTKLFNQRERSIDLLGNIEVLINSVANHPKSFDAAIEEIRIKKQEFRGVCDFAKEELEAAKKSAAGVTAGVTGGIAVASLAPSAAMWIATTFGTASTGTAISTLSGAAATNAALAWLGGGAVAAGGGGMAAGQAFLALAGPVGWGIAGATLLTSIVLFANKKMKLDKEKKKEIEAVLQNTERLRETDVVLSTLLQKTTEIREGLSEQYTEALHYFGKNFLEVPDSGQYLLSAIVNNAKALAASLGEGV